MATNNVLFVIASIDYQPVEYAVPKKLLEQAGFVVTTAADQGGTATAKDGSTTPVDLLINDVDVTHYDGIFFIGGPGALDHLDNEASYKILTAAALAHKPFGAICVATRILAKAGVLKGKKATGWNGDNALNALYKEYDVQYAPNELVVDDGIITATGPQVAREFGEQIIALLQE